MPDSTIMEMNIDFPGPKDHPGKVNSGTLTLMYWPGLANTDKIPIEYMWSDVNPEHYETDRIAQLWRIDEQELDEVDDLEWWQSPQLEKCERTLEHWGFQIVEDVLPWA
jgi:hypothetical protein